MISLQLPRDLLTLEQEHIHVEGENNCCHPMPTPTPAAFTIESHKTEASEHFGIDLGRLVQVKKPQVREKPLVQATQEGCSWPLREVASLVSE